MNIQSQGPDSPRQLLFEELRHRQLANPRYSLRAFAGFLQISPGRLSQYIAGKRDITPRSTKKICERLALSPTEEARIIGCASKRKGRPVLSRPDEDFYLLPEDNFRILADWEHFAILSVIRLKGIRHQPSDLAQRLGISETQAGQALERLIKAGLLKKHKGRYVRTQERLRTSDGIFNRALRISHRQGLTQAMESLENVPLALRDITSITMPISTRRIRQAKERIKSFRREMSEFLEGEDADQIYNLNVQLVPVTKVEPTNEN